ncbi:MAG: NADH-quinone oxidoreductase subunit NuoG [Actinomycetota bacterium]|nr:NADH-quinone oxidoreductase subunit NuoG [Actinomycetota bacterium]
MTDTTATDAVAVTINGTEIAANKGELLIDAAERHGVYIPRFCYHNRMRPVGMCRMCIVEVDTGRGPALQPSCMLPVSDGMKVETESPVTKKAQDGVLEFLLINHPLDCPVCDKGGECPLQDQTLAFGPGETRFVEEKRHFEKPIPISDLVDLDRERCILCDRCTRFAKEVAGDPLIHFIDRGGHTQVNTFPDDPFSSYFSGNTVQICPVGALTSSLYRFRARPWDLEEIESVATTDTVGSRIVVQSSRNEVLRYLGVDSEAINWSWLSDRERFNFQSVNSEDRLSEPLLRDGDELAPARWSEALAKAAEAIDDAVTSGGPSRVAVLGGARLTNEDQYAWARLAKGVIGTDNVDAQLADGLPPELVLGVPRATIADACRPGGTVIYLGPDPKERLGALFLRLRHAVVEDGVTLIELGSHVSGLTRYAHHSLLAPAGHLGRVTRAMLSDSPAETSGIGAEALTAARDALRAANGPVTLLIGRPAITEDPSVVADATAQLLGALDDASVLPLLSRGNVFGALDMGLSPGLLPGRTSLADGGAAWSQTWGKVPEATGLDAAGILTAAADGDIDVLVLLGADPIADAPDRGLVERAIERTGTVIALDQFLTDSSGLADIVFPVAGFTEVNGTFTNLEGRVLTQRQKVTPPGSARSDWMIAAELSHRLGGSLGPESVDALWAEVVAGSELHAAVSRSALEARENADGIVVGGTGSLVFEPAAEAPRVPPTDSYSQRLTLAARMYDNGVLTRKSPGLAQLAGPGELRVQPSVLAGLGLSDGDTVRASTAKGSIELPIVADETVLAGTAVLGANLGGVESNRLLDIANPITDIRLETT